MAGKPVKEDAPASEPRLAYCLRTEPDEDMNVKMKMLDEKMESIVEIVLYPTGVELLIQRLTAIKEGWVQHHSSTMVH